MKVTIEIKPPTKEFEEEFSYAVLFGDSSGVLAVVRDSVWASKVAKALTTQEDSYLPFIVRKVIKKELT